MECYALPLFVLQGGGVYVDGVANFEDCNIHDNIATVCACVFELSLHFHPAPAELIVDAAFVCAVLCERLHFEPSLVYLPLPHWELTLLLRLAGRGDPRRAAGRGNADKHQCLF